MGEWKGGRERGRERGKVEGRERRFYSWHVGVNAVLCVVCGTVYIAIHNYVGVSVIRPRVCVDGSMGSCFVGKRREGEEGERRREGEGNRRKEGEGGRRGREGGRVLLF